MTCVVAREACERKLSLALDTDGRGLYTHVSLEENDMKRIQHTTPTGYRDTATPIAGIGSGVGFRNIGMLDGEGAR